MKHALFFIVFYTAASAFAAHPLVFNRDILTIIPKEEPVVQTEDEEKEAKPEAPREPIRFYTEIRSQQMLDLNWVHSLNGIGPERTMTILFDPPRYDSITTQPFYQPLDVVSISPEGVIVQIVPNLVLAHMGAPIDSSRPIRARLLLQGGAVETLGIKPGDRVEHPLFVPAPKVMTE